MKRHTTIRALKGQHLPAQGKRPQGATPWVRRHTTIRALKGQKHYTSNFEDRHSHTVVNLLPFQGARQMRIHYTQGVGSHCSPYPGLSAFGPSGRKSDKHLRLKQNCVICEIC